MASPYSVPDVETKSTMPIRLAFHFLQLSLHGVVLYSSFTSFFLLPFYFMLLIVTIFMSEFNGSDEIDAAYGA